jgi:hypothetical protein
MTTKAPALPLSQSARHAGRHPRKEVTTMIKRIKEALFFGRKPARDPREFNGELLDQRREDVFVLLHQQMGGLR